jgi:hypothetical protein
MRSEVWVSETLAAGAELIRRRAADLAASLAARSRRAATIAQERAVLRMLGVDGLDRDGKPLAASSVDRYCGVDPRRIGRGILMPFVAAMAEYELPARDIALEVAAGSIDLGLEAELLERPERRAAAERQASDMIRAAFLRLDANRTAIHDLRDVLGQAAEPWLGVTVKSAEVGAAASEVRRQIAQGADLVEVWVPAGWEFAEVRRRAGLDIPGAFRTGSRAAAGAAAVRRLGRGRKERYQTAAGAPSPPGAIRTADEPIPAGSQRGLAELRKAADESAAQRGGYASLMTVTSAFAAPEQAVVAGFERIDYVEADPIREIVEDNVDPDRALADHAFAHRLEARAGCRLFLGPGPLALGADVAAGIPPNAVSRAGRALALQALGVEIALADGLAPDRLLLGAVPNWVAGDGEAGSAILQTHLRRLLFPDQRLALAGPGVGLSSTGSAIGLVAALSGSPVSLVLERGELASVSAASSDLATATAVAKAVRAAFAAGSLSSDAQENAGRILTEAEETLARLASEGWASLLGPARERDETGRLGRSAVVDRDLEGSSGTILDGML